MKKFLFVIGIVTALLTSTAIAVTANTSVSSRPGDGVTTCEVYGADGYTATVVEKVIVGKGSQYLMEACVKLNKGNETNHVIKVVVQLRDSNYDVIETTTVTISNGGRQIGCEYFTHRGESGKAYYITINNASCN